jgi:peroxiredoxin
LQKNLGQLEARGVRVLAISVDSPAINREHTAKQGYTFTFLSDEKAEVIRRYDLLHEKGFQDADISRPAEFLVDTTGTIRWVNLTGDYRVRLRPEELFEVLDCLGRTGPQ